MMRNRNKDVVATTSRLACGITINVTVPQIELTWHADETSRVRELTWPADETSHVRELTWPADETSRVRELTWPADETSRVRELTSPADDTSRVRELTWPADDTSRVRELTWPVDETSSVRELTWPADETSRVMLGSSQDRLPHKREPLQSCLSVPMATLPALHRTSRVHPKDRATSDLGRLIFVKHASNVVILVLGRGHMVQNILYFFHKASLKSECVSIEHDNELLQQK